MRRVRETSEYDNVCSGRKPHGRRFKGMSVNDFLNGGFMEEDEGGEVCHVQTHCP